MALKPRMRTLTPAERRLLRCKARRLGSHSGDVGRATWLAAGVAGVLWALTLLASDAPWPVVTAFWLLAGGALALWTRRGLQRDLRHLRAMASALASALERNEAESCDIVAERYAEFEEVEDEGACYAFDLGDGRVAFVVGQEFYPAARFPSLDFSLVYPLDESGTPADMWIEKRGDAVPPERVIPAEVKWRLAEAIPAHLGVVQADLETLEAELRRREP